MTNGEGQLDSVEKALLELDAAERGGVFDTTRVDPEALLRSGLPRTDAEPVSRSLPSAHHRMLHLGVRLIAAAAAVVLVIGVWGWVFSADSGPQQGSLADGRAADMGDVYASGFRVCFDGPTGTSQIDCGQFDSDADGDVDLADFSAFQLAYAGVTR